MAEARAGGEETDGASGGGGKRREERKVRVLERTSRMKVEQRTYWRLLMRTKPRKKAETMRL